MKLKNLIFPIAALVFGLCISDARAVSLATTTNIVTITGMAFYQGTTNISDGDTVYNKTNAVSYGSTQLIQELLADVNLASNSEAKLALIDDNFYVISGATVTNVSAFLTIQTAGANDIKSGEKNGGTDLAFKSITDTQLLEIVFSDGNVQFTITGLATGTVTDSAPKDGTYTESFKGSISDMNGSGTGTKGDFLITAKATVSGTGVLPYPPPS